MNDERNEKEMVICPVGKLLMNLGKAAGGDSAFHEHMNRSRIEFLKAIKSLVDEKISHLEKKEGSEATDRMTKIEVE